LISITKVADKEGQDEDAALSLVCYAAWFYSMGLNSTLPSLWLTHTAYTHTKTCMCMHTHTNTLTHTAYTHQDLHVHAHTHKHTDTHKQTHTDTHVHAHTHLLVYTHMHACIYRHAKTGNLIDRKNEMEQDVQHTQSQKHCFSPPALGNHLKHKHILNKNTNATCNNFKDFTELQVRKSGN
jgi:hypothetical protein